jgi:hypothetical protein
MPLRLIAAAFFGLLLLAPPASAKTTSAKLVFVKGGKTDCFATIPVEGRGINCSSVYLPDTGELDPYVGLKPHGAAVLSERGDYAGYSNAKRATLRPGDRWTWHGIRCIAATNTITCRNLDGRGFTIGPDGYTPR